MKWCLIIYVIGTHNLTTINLNSEDLCKEALEQVNKNLRIQGTDNLRAVCVKTSYTN